MNSEEDGYFILAVKGESALLEEALFLRRKFQGATSKEQNVAQLMNLRTNALMKNFKPFVIKILGNNKVFSNLQHKFKSQLSWLCIFNCIRIL